MGQGEVGSTWEVAVVAVYRSAFVGTRWANYCLDYTNLLIRFKSN